MSRLPGYISMSPSPSLDSLSRSSLSPSPTPTPSVGNSGTATPTGIGRSPHKTDIRQVLMSLHRKPPPHPSHDNDRKLNIYGTASQFFRVEPISTTSSNATRVDTTSSNTTHTDPTSTRPTRIQTDPENGHPNGYHDTHTSYYRGTGPTHPFLHSFTSSIRAPTPAQGEYDEKWNDEFPITPRSEGGVSYDGPPSVSPARFHTDSTWEHPLPTPCPTAPPSSRIYILFSLFLVTFFRILFDNICYIGNRILESWHGCRDDVEIQHIAYGEREYQVMDRIVRTKPLDTCDDPKQIMKRYHSVHDQRYIIRAIALIWSILPSSITHLTTYITRSIWGVPAKSSPPASQEPTRTPIPVVYFHGGGWCCVSKDLIRPYITFFTQSLGHTLYNVDYARSPKYVFPHALISAIQALTYIKQKDGHDRIIIAGDSAGANLAVMLTMLLQHQTMRDAFNQQIRGAYPRSSSGLCIDINELPSIAAVVVAYGTMDRQSFLAPSTRFPWIVGFTMRLLYNIYRNDSPNAQKKAKSQSDAIYFERSSNFYGNFCPLDFQAFLDSTFPPTCMVIGTEDPLYDGNRRFAETLRRLNVPVRECIYGNLLHGFLTFPWDRRRFRAQLDIASWFEQEHETVTMPVETDGKDYISIAYTC